MADRASFRLDRKRAVVHEERQTGRGRARLSDRNLCGGQACTLEETAPEEEPKTPQHWCKGTASLAAPQQEAHLFHRLFRKPLQKQEICKAKDCSQAPEQGPEISWTTERRRPGSSACG